MGVAQLQGLAARLFASFVSELMRGHKLLVEDGRGGVLCKDQGGRCPEVCEMLYLKYEVHAWCALLGWHGVPSPLGPRPPCH